MTALGAAALELLRDWLPSNGALERPQMQLATVDASGRPDARTVLLSEWDEDGFAFHTDAESRKIAELAANPAVALVLLWPGFTRQLVIRGVAERASPARLERAFALRSPYLRQLAWQNSTAFAQLDRASRVEAWQRFSEEHDVATLPPPATWTGYVVRPDRLTFWESDPAGPSHRLELRLEGGTWSEHHLAG